MASFRHPAWSVRQDSRYRRNDKRRQRRASSGNRNSHCVTKRKSRLVHVLRVTACSVLATKCSQVDSTAPPFRAGRFEGPACRVLLPEVLYEASSHRISCNPAKQLITTDHGLFLDGCRVGAASRVTYQGVAAQSSRTLGLACSCRLPAFAHTGTNSRRD